MLFARNTERLKVWVEEQQASKSVAVEYLDLEDSGQLEATVIRAQEHFGGVDLLINNAGISQRSEAIQTTMEVDRRIMQINYFGNVGLTKAALPYLLQSRKPSIVVVSSLSGKFGFFQRSAYAAAKHALHGFYESLRLELDEQGVKVLLACPSFVATSIDENALDNTGKANGQKDARLQEGMSPEACAKSIAKAEARGKKEIVIGTKGRFAVWLSKCFPNIFFRVLKKQSAA